ncbi:MoxR-like ATPase [Natranaerovirga pectinivora]|uniref:MoxR-like ATPase n=1 Tax=Natranaerovirga pectinivora TaxID=682400 RepID=A0A4R3MNB1_9FIRM|nr:MoxR family ATPase [Natranaerovirga pectinivora]TCT16717.1 MoxR-like ATPase [Natranaerovirga pectinivora]
MEKQNVISLIVDNIEKVIIGKRKVIERVVISLICEGHVLIEDVPGVGKTTLISALSKSISASYNRIQFTPDVMPSDITGFSMYNPKSQEFEYKSGSIMSNIILADEINRTPPKTQSSLLEAMEEGQVTIDGNTYKLPRPFSVFATQNPIEYLGTYPLPEAQLDRFIMKVSVGYPDQKEEEFILRTYNLESPLAQLKGVATKEDIVEMQQEIKLIYISDEIRRYIVQLVSKTRKEQDVVLGASPRGSLFLMSASKAWAYYKGRHFVTPDDVQELYLPVIAHRITLRQEAKLKEITPEYILRKILRETEVPTGVNNEEK